MKKQDNLTKLHKFSLIPVPVTINRVVITDSLFKNLIKVINEQSEMINNLIDTVYSLGTEIDDNDARRITNDNELLKKINTCNSNISALASSIKTLGGLNK